MSLLIETPTDFREYVANEIDREGCKIVEVAEALCGDPGRIRRIALLAVGELYRNNQLFPADYDDWSVAQWINGLHSPDALDCAEGLRDVARWIAKHPARQSDGVVKFEFWVRIIHEAMRLRMSKCCAVRETTECAN